MFFFMGKHFQLSTCPSLSHSLSNSQSHTHSVIKSLMAVTQLQSGLKPLVHLLQIDRNTSFKSTVLLRIFKYFLSLL